MMRPLIERVLANSHEDCDCVIWDGWISHRGTTGCPRIHYNGKPASLRRVLFEELNGRPVKRKHRIGVSCGMFGCVEPSHLVERTRAKETLGMRRPVSHSVKIAGYRRASSVLTWDIVREIRCSSLTGAELARQHKLSPDHVSKIRLHRIWRELDSNPFVGLGARG